MKSFYRYGLTVLLLLTFFAAGFFVSRQRYYQPEPTINDPCAGDLRAASIDPINNILRAFDETSLIAFSLTRSQVVEPVTQMQAYRLELANHATPACLISVKDEALTYMDGVINVFRAFIQGTSSDEVQSGLEAAKAARLTLEAELGQFLGATVTPYPTPMEMVIVPVTGRLEPTPVRQITASPTLAVLQATVNYPQGVNLRVGPGLDYTFHHIVADQTSLYLTGRNEAGDWVYTVISEIEEGGGWLFTPLLVIDGDVSVLPVIAAEE